MPILARLLRVLDGRFDHPRWDDIKPNLVSVGSGSAALDRKAIRTGAPLYDHFVRNQTDVLIYSFQTEHGWDGTIVRPHAHVIPTSLVVGDSATVLGNVYWLFRWAWTGIGTGLKIPVGSAWTNLNITQPITIGNQMEELIVGPSITPPSGLPLSAHLHVEMSRLGTNALDTYDSDSESGTAAANLALVSVDCHARRIRTGSKYETADY